MPPVTTAPSGLNRVEARQPIPDHPLTGARRDRAESVMILAKDPGIDATAADTRPIINKHR